MREKRPPLKPGDAYFPPGSEMRKTVQNYRRNSYRDPDLSNRWLDEAEWRARREFRGDAAKIIIRLIKEVRRLNRMMGR